MFKRKETTVDIVSSPTVERSHSVLSQAVVITGEIKSKDDLRIDGCIEGNVYCGGKVVIGQNGSVNGNIESQSVELMGKVTGDIVAHNLIRLKTSSYFQGDITTVNIEIESGANFFGNCKMIDDKAIESPKIQTNELESQTELKKK